VKGGKKYKNTKRCLACNIVKKLDDNFRIVNSINGYTSKTCRTCESLVGLDLLDDTKSPDGFIYLIFDSAFPEYIKVGYTVDKINRLRSYNKNRPLDTCSFIYVSKLLTNILDVEQGILRRINTYAYSTPNRYEWFSIQYKEKIIEEIKLAEDDVNNHPNINQEFLN
jgi:hypothetical protein